MSDSTPPPAAPDLSAHLAYLISLAERYRSQCASVGWEPRDLAQETLLKAQTACQGGRVARESDLVRQLHKIMANRLIDEQRRHASQKHGGGKVGSLDDILADFAQSALRIDHLLLPAQPGPRTMAQKHDARRIVTAEIQALPPPQATAVNLHHIHGYPVEAIATEMGWTFDQARGYLQRGMATLKERLGKRDDLGLDSSAVW